MQRKIMLTALAAAFIAVMFLTAAPAEARHPYQGYIYGKVTTRSGNSYTGLLRWGTEEAFWDDIFHSYKESRPYADKLEEITDVDRGELRDLERELKSLARDEEKLAREESKIAARETKTRDKDEREEFYEQRREIAEQRREIARERDDLAREIAAMQMAGRRRKISVLGGAIHVNVGGWNTSRIFAARFGDIKRITVVGSEDAELEMKSGSMYTVSGYANDVGGTIHIRDNSLGDIDLDWRRIDTIEFMETPKDVKPEGYRMHGTLLADGVEYKGFIQWDSEECLSTDEIDGHSEDGKLAIEMGNIRSIERRSRSSSWITLHDGRKLTVEGTNDVDASIRGIMVEDQRYGRLEVNWDAFEQVTFDKEAGSGLGYDDYPKGKRLRGTVTDLEGNSYKGLLIYDVDESEDWEMLDGDLFDIEFSIPFKNVKSIRPRSRNSSTVTLRNGESLRLEGGQDVTQSNDGILVFENEKDEKPVLIEWDNLEVVEFD
jgi:hypothetical protein